MVHLLLACVPWQAWEMAAHSMEILGDCDESYPLQAQPPPRLTLPDSSQIPGTCSHVSALCRARMLSVNLALVVHSARSAF